MTRNNQLIPKVLSEEPIALPGSPFWNVFKRFGADELISMFVNVIGTWIASFFVGSLFILSIVGPIVEKIGFFPMHLKDAWGVYKTTPKKQRKALGHYLARAMKNGTTSLIEDIIVHDPIYIILMLVGLNIYPNTPVWILSATSFIIAIIAVSILEVGFREFQYIKLKRKMKRAGLDLEKYLESRFFISTKENPKKLLSKISKEFKLSRPISLDYYDSYFDNNLPIFSGRVPKVRLRKRTDILDKGWKQSIQIVYTRSLEKSITNYEQYRYFPIKKEKFYFVFSSKMPKNINEIDKRKIKRVLKYSKNKAPLSKITFTRMMAKNNELFVSIDKINKKDGFYVLELKVYKDAEVLIEAMRFVMQEFPVIQTTKGKIDFDINF
jgi:hypothetical protein